MYLNIGCTKQSGDLLIAPDDMQKAFIALNSYYQKRSPVENKTDH